MEDDRKLCEYSLPEGAVISALFEPNVDINIEVSTGQQVQKLKVSNATSIKALKTQISGVMKCGVAPEKLEFKFGEITLEDPMPLHFYGVEDESKLDVLKPYINVILEYKGNQIYWRLNRKDTIAEVKVKLPTKSRGTEDLNDDAKVEQLRLYLVTDGQKFDELDDDKTVENCNIKENNRLYLLSYVWTQNLNKPVTRDGIELQGLEEDDTCFIIRVKAQDQFGISVSSSKVVRLVEHEWGENPTGSPTYFGYLHDYVREFKQLTEISDVEIPFKYKEPLSIVTEEELEADREEEKAWREAVRKAHNSGDRGEMKKMGYLY